MKRPRDPHVCTRCHWRSPMPNRASCLPCLRKQRERDRALRTKRRRLKLCIACGHTPKRGIAVVTKRPYAHCPRCLRNYKHWSKAWLKRNPRPLRRGPRPETPVYAQIREALEILGPTTGKEIAEGLALHPDSIYVQLARMRMKGVLRKKEDGRWTTA